MGKQLTTLDFIKKSKTIHGDIYNYNESEYVNVKTKVSVICEEHGRFIVWPSDHMRGTGCRKCANMRIKNKLTYSKEQFIKKAAAIHGNVYNYEYIKYLNHKTPIEIICKEHGSFLQKPYHHLNGSGCQICGQKQTGKYNTAQYIEMVRNVHNNKYDYSITKYNTSHDYLEIICPIHGKFNQIAYYHLQGSGCPMCTKNNYSLMAIEWLNEISKKENIYIQHAENEGEYVIPNTKYKADGYCEKTNTIYEFYGDCWHGNLEIYEPNTKCHPFNSNTALELYKYTMEREQTILNRGFNLISIWESEYSV